MKKYTRSGKTRITAYTCLHGTHLNAKCWQLQYPSFMLIVCGIFLLFVTVITCCCLSKIGIFFSVYDSDDNLLDLDSDITQPGQFKSSIGSSFEYTDSWIVVWSSLCSYGLFLALFASRKSLQSIMVLNTVLTSLFAVSRNKCFRERFKSRRNALRKTAAKSLIYECIHVT